MVKEQLLAAPTKVLSLRFVVSLLSHQAAHDRGGQERCNRELVIILSGCLRTWEHKDQIMKTATMIRWGSLRPVLFYIIKLYKMSARKKNNV